MDRPGTPAWLLALLVAVLASVVSCLLTTWLIAPPKAAVSAGSRTEESWAEVLAELRELRNKIETMPRQLPAREPGDAVDVRKLVSAPERGADRSADLIRKLERLVRSGQPYEARSLAAHRDLPANHSALASLIDLHHRDEKAATRSVRMLNLREVAGRFGFPDEVGTGNGSGIYWSYTRTAAQHGRDGRVVFTFTGGYVTSVFIKE